MTSRFLVLGIGNDYRGDDTVGLEVARRIRAAGMPGLVKRQGRDCRQVPLGCSVLPATPRDLVLRGRARQEPASTDITAGIGGAAHSARALTGVNGVLIEEVTGDMVEMIDMWQGWDTVVLVDAVHSGTPHGSVLRFDALAEPLPRIFSSHVSSHGVGVAEVIELARALDRLPKELIVYGIEGRVFSAGAGLSSEVEAVVDQTAERILQEFRALI